MSKMITQSALQGLSVKQLTRLRDMVEMQLRLAEQTRLIRELKPRTYKSSGKPIQPIYRHPDNPAITWTGRGRRPRWMTELEEEQGVNRERLRIPGSDIPRGL